MQDRVRELFGVLRQSDEKDDFAVIDGGQSLDAVEEQVLSTVLSAMQRVDEQSSPLRKVLPW